MATATNDESDLTARPIYWFVLWEEALDRGDLEAAVNAERELAKLGVHVTYRRRRPKGKGVCSGK